MKLKSRKVAVVLLAIGLIGPAYAGPITELYKSHLTYFEDFGTEAISNSSREIAAVGLFGTMGLKRGSTNMYLKVGQTALDTTRAGTILYWVKKCATPEPVSFSGNSGYEPSNTHMLFQWHPQKRYMLYRQAGATWGNGQIYMFFEWYNENNQRKTASVSYPGSIANWKEGEWHLVASQFTPNTASISVDGQAFKSVQLPTTLGAFTGNWFFQAHTYEDLDDCAVLDFKMSDDQIKELYDEYQAELEEAPKTEESPTCALKTAAKTTTVYEIAVTLTNNSPNTVEYRFEYTATPTSSQPILLSKVVSFAPGEVKTVALEGHITGEETIVADVKVTRVQGGEVVFRRYRTFAPNSHEPKWMHENSRVATSFAYYPSTNTVHALIDCTSCTNLSDITALRLSILSATNKEIIATQDWSPDTSGKTEIFWRNLPDLNGEYICRMQAVGSGEPECDEEFCRFHYEWEGNSYGKSSAVPAPFHEVRVEDEVEVEGVGVVEGVSKVSVILREHLVDKETGLWRQVTAEGKELLARPMSLITTSNLQPLSFNLPTKSTWDVDGMYELRLTLPAGHYEPMAFEIPLKAERAKLYHACTDGIRINKAGGLTNGIGRIWSSADAPHSSIVGNYVPYLWVGGAKRGIAIFGENDKGWLVNRESPKALPCQEIIREEDGTIVIRLNLIQLETDLTEPQTIRLGFQATPVKPMMENWRSKSRGSLLGACLYWGGGTSYDSVEPFDGTDDYFLKMAEASATGSYSEAYVKDCAARFPYPQTPGTAEWTNRYNSIVAHFRSGQWNAAQRGISRRAGKDSRLVFYTNGRGVHYGNPKRHGETYCNEWNRFEYMSRQFTIGSTASYDLDPLESFRDYATWWYERMLSTGAGDHLYWDDVFCQSSFNLVQSDAYRLPNGTIQPASGIFNMRALIRRCAVLQAELGKDATGNWVHMTNTAMAPVLAFAGVNYDWEDISADTTFQERYTREYILSCTIGRQFGNRVGIMGYYKTEQGTARLNFLAHAGVGVMLTHEIWWNESNHAEYAAVLKALKAWGYCGSEVEVFNYFDEDVEFPAEVQGVTVASIAMVKPEKGEAMICVSSFDATNGVLKVTPDLEGLGFSAGDYKAELMMTNSTGLVTKETLEVKDGAIEFPLDAYEWELIKITAPIKLGEVDLESLPEGCDELVEFVETDGEAWIDTGFKPNPKRHRPLFRFIPLERPTDDATRIALFGVNGTKNECTGNKAYSAAIGHWSDAGVHINPLWCGSGGGYHYPNTGNYAVGRPYSIDFRMIDGVACAYVNQGHKCGGYYSKYDGVVEGSVIIGDIRNGTALYSETTTDWRRGKMRYLGFEVWDTSNNEKLADFRPAKRDGIFGFYDSITGRFFKSRGREEFKGPEYVAWSGDGVPVATGKVAVVAAGATKRVAYPEIAEINELAGVKLEGEDSTIIFTNGLTTTALTTSFSGKGHVVALDSKVDSTANLYLRGDSTFFTGDFAFTNAGVYVDFAPFALGTTNKVIINNSGSKDTRRFSVNATSISNEFHIVRVNSLFFGNNTPTIMGKLYLDLPGGVTFHGNSQRLYLNCPIETTAINNRSTAYLNANVTLGGGEAASKYFAKLHVQGASTTYLGSPLRFDEVAYTATIYDSCNYSWNGGAKNVFAMTNVFEDSVFFLCNYAKANSNTNSATLNLNGYDQVIGTLGVYTVVGFNPAIHYNTNMVITSEKPAVLTIRRTCRNDNAANVFHGRITGAASLCLDSNLATPGAIRFCAPGIKTTGKLDIKRGTVKFDATADGARFGSIVFGVEGALEIASNTTIYAETAYRGARPMNPGARTYGEGTLIVESRLIPPSPSTIYLR